MGEVILTMKGIDKSFPGVHALDHVDLEIRKGEVLALMGENGAGKSTLMNIIGCLDIPDSGDYILDGDYVDDCTENELSEIRGTKIGFIFQQFNLLSDLTAYENVEMPLLYHKIPKAERKERVLKTLAQVGLSDRIYHKPSQLSGGQQQRVAIARVLANRPSIILADEPTGNLDSESSKEIMDIIQSLWKQGNTIVLITHDINVANQAARKVYVHDGMLTDEARRKL